MKHLLNLLAAIALLVWSTSLVRTGVIRVFGANLRAVLARGVGNRFAAVLSGIGVTALVQSSTATSLITSSFVGQGLIGLPAALAVMRGADIGTGLMSVLFSADLSWLSPLFIFTGVLLFITRQAGTVGNIGRVFIGLGLMLLALQLVVAATEPLLASAATRAVLQAVSSDVLLEIFMGALFAIAAYSSLAIVLLIGAMASSGAVSIDVALALVLGANLGSGLLAVLTTARSPVEARQLTAGSLVFKLLGIVMVLPLTGTWVRLVQPMLPGITQGVVLFHLAFNITMGLAFIGLTDRLARGLERLMPCASQGSGVFGRIQHLDPLALASPPLAISCAAREALHQADVVETMLVGVLKVIHENDVQLAARLRKLDDTVDSLYSSIKYYLTKLSRQTLDGVENRRWTDIISFTINMEQIADLIERVLVDIEHKKISKGLSFSEAGLAEISELHAQLVENLRLSMSLFLHGNIHGAQRLLEEKARFRELERSYATTHLYRLSENSLSSIKTSSLHIDLISDFRRINSHICSIAYPILESAGILAPSRSRSIENPRQIA